MKRIVCFLLCIFFITGLSLHAQTIRNDASKIVIDVNLKNATASQIIDKLFANTDINYIISSQNPEKKYDIKMNNITLEKALDIVAPVCALLYAVKDGTYTFYSTTEASELSMINEQPINAASATTDIADTSNEEDLQDNTTEDDIVNTDQLTLEDYINLSQVEYSIGNVLYRSHNPTLLISGGRLYMVSPSLNGMQYQSLGFEPVRFGANRPKRIQRRPLIQRRPSLRENR